MCMLEGTTVTKFKVNIIYGDFLVLEILTISRVSAIIPDRKKHFLK